MSFDAKSLIILATAGFVVGFFAVVTADLIWPTPAPKEPAVTVAAQEPTRIVGPAFVPEH